MAGGFIAVVSCRVPQQSGAEREAEALAEGAHSIAIVACEIEDRAEPGQRRTQPELARLRGSVAATSAKDGKDSRTFPALGYEFIEDGVARCAVQYFGGGAFGANKSVIWLGTDLDPDMKLVLAAAMSSILQVKVKLN
jgi:hypothetical protein